MALPSASISLTFVRVSWEVPLAMAWKVIRASTPDPVSLCPGAVPQSYAAGWK
jgi:hypothetical protein